MRHFSVGLAAALAVCSSAARSADWYEAKSAHFIIYSDESPDRLRNFALRLEKFDKAMRLIRRMDDPALTDARRVTIFTLPSGRAVADLAGIKEALGLYIPRSSGSFAFVPRDFQAGGDTDLRGQEIFFHEYAHHIQLQYSALALPVWFREGFAEFFATAEISRDGGAMVGQPPGYRLRTLVGNAPRLLPTEKILGETYERLSPEQGEELYSIGWFLTHYLTFDPTRKGQLTRYLASIQEGVTPIEAAKSAFGDLKMLERDLERYKSKRLTAISVDKAALIVAPIAVRKITPGQAAIMSVHIRSTRGVSEATAPKIAAEARQVGAKFPADPFVQAALAEAEFDARNYAAADAAADRALAADPRHAHALIYKGRAQMELARQAGAKADWPAVRKWFLAANKVDTEDAEPLELFYRSFMAAGQRPTKNAIDGLLYAVVLAPQDDSLRLAAFRQLLSDKKAADAKRMFAPLAFKPHASAGWREASRKIMNALDAGDLQTAASLSQAPSATDDARKPNAVYGDEQLLATVHSD